MAKVIIYSTDNCPYCRLAKELLSERSIAYEEIRIDLDDNKREEMMRLSNRRSSHRFLLITNPLVVTMILLH